MRKLLIIFAVIIISACTKDITDFNEDTKNPEAVPASSLIANATVELFDYMTEPNVNINNFRLYAQHWAQTTYPDESNYELVERNVNGRAWNTMYATVLRDLKEAKPLIQEDKFLSDGQKAAQFAIIGVIEAYVYAYLVDVFGNIPYTEALSDVSTPAYDDAATVYNSVIDNLDAAIQDLSGDSGLGEDLIYGGSTASWKMFANSLKLKLAIRLADLDDAKAKTMAMEAVDGGVFTSSADDFKLNYESTTPNTNPLWEQLVQSGRSDFVAANTFADVLNPLNDPRRPFFFTNLGENDTVHGGVYGTANSFPENSQPGLLLEDPTFPGVIMSYTEVLFLLADAVERGYITGDAAEYYHNGIKNSIMEWGGSEADADTYLAQDAVNYATAEGTWKQKIAMQKWIALYNMGFEAWTTYRVYDWPDLPPAADTDRDVIQRFTYPVTEHSLNGTNLEAAVAAMGGDDIHMKVFWDVN